MRQTYQITFDVEADDPSKLPSPEGIKGQLATLMLLRGTAFLGKGTRVDKGSLRVDRQPQDDKVE